MKVLFVTLFPLENNTSVTISNYGLLRGLQSLGHDITVLMPYASADGTSQIPYDVSGMRIVRVDGIPFSLLHQAPKKQTIWYKIKRKWHKWFDFLDFTAPYLQSGTSVSLLDEHFDLIISTSDPKTTHVFVKKLINKGLSYGRWIQHWGDPMYGDITRSNAYPNCIVKWYERRIIKWADKVVYVSPFTADMLKQAHPQYAEKIHFVPLPCEEVEQTPLQEKTDLLKLVYLGDYSPSIRNILPLYDAVKELEGVQLTIAGISLLKLDNTDHITVLPRIPQTQCHQLEAEADVSITVCNLRGTQIPGKVYYAAASQKHMLVILDGDEKDKLRAYIESFNRYIVCDNNVESIKEALKTIQSAQGRVEYQVPEIFLPENNVREVVK